MGSIISALEALLLALTEAAIREFAIQLIALMALIAVILAPLLTVINEVLK